MIERLVPILVVVAVAAMIFAMLWLVPPHDEPDGGSDAVHRETTQTF